MVRSRRSRSSRSSSRHRSRQPLGVAARLQVAGDMVLTALFLLLLVGAPLPMGGNRVWAWAPMVVVISIFAMLSAAGLGNRRGLALDPAEKRPFTALLACFLITIGWAWLQTTTLLPAGASAAFYATAAEMLGRPNRPVISLSVDDSFYAILRCAACGLIFLIARMLCSSERQAHLLLYGLMTSAMLVLIYAFLGLSRNSCYVGSYLKKQGEYQYGDHCLMSGTFVNSNSFACFLGMAAVAAIGLMFTQSATKRRHQSYEEFAEDEDDNRFVTKITGQRLVMVALVLLFAGGMLISASRAGFAATIVAAVLLGILLTGRRGRTRRQTFILIGVAVFFVVAMVILSGGSFMRKLGNFSQVSSFDRYWIWRTTFEAIEKSPWLGWGMGNFTDIYTILQPSQIPIANDRAHSTPLETILELGLPVGLIACLVVLIPWAVIWRGVFRRSRRALPATAFASAGVAIIHSTVDFSLQMPAIAFFTSALLGMGWAQAFATNDAVSQRFTGESP